MKALCVALLVLGDLIVLKDGRTVEGVYVGEDGESVRYRDALGQMHVEPKSTVLEVKRVPTKSNFFEAIASALTADRPGDYFYLCEWAEEQGLQVPVERLCRIAIADENVRARAFLKLGRLAKDEEARALRRSAVAADPSIVDMVSAPGEPKGKKTVLPESFRARFASSLKAALGGSYVFSLSGIKRSLAELDAVQRRDFDADFKRRTGMTVQSFFSRLEALSKVGKVKTCPHCHGTRYISCAECGGKGWKRCAGCRGGGYRIRAVAGSVGRYEEIRACGKCKGSGRANCGRCSPLKAPEMEEVEITFPDTPKEHVHMPGARLAFTRSTVTTYSDGRTTRTVTKWSGVSGASVRFHRRSSGRRPCPHCGKKSEGRVRSFTLTESGKLGALARELAVRVRETTGGLWSGSKARSIEEQYSEQRVEPEEAQAFYKGKWMTSSSRRMHLSATGGRSPAADASRLEAWKPGYKCRVIAEDAIDVPADPRAWTGLLRMYSLQANSPKRTRLASRQVFHASFRRGRGEASVLSRGGEFLAVAEPELVLEPDRRVKLAGAGDVELWFRILKAAPGKTAKLEVSVLAVRSGEKTVPLF